MNTEVIRCPSGPELPAFTAGAGKKLRCISWSSSPSTSATTTFARPTGQAAGALLLWCEDRGIRRIEDVEWVDVAGYIEQFRRRIRLRPSSSISNI
jgi:hypothetical protein